VAVISRRNLTFSPASTLLTLAKTKIRQGLALTTTLLLTVSSFAQQTSPATPPPDSSDNSQPALGKGITVTVPAGTRIALVLTQPVQTRYLHRGDDVYAQITSPVSSGDEVVIPPGTFVQGKFDRLERKGDRGELRLQSMAITFPDGYVAPVPGPISMESDEGYALKDPGKGRMVGTFAMPAAGLGIGALIGHSFGHSASLNTTNNCGFNPNCLPQTSVTPDTKLRDTAIGSMVGLAIGGVGSLFLFFNSHNFYLDIGSPVQMVLQQPLTLDVDQVADAIQQSEQHPTARQPIIQQAQRVSPPPDSDHGICYTPGTPGTPDTDIPGTPAIGDSPGTPPTHIPGIPATAPTAYPCP
jgi:hypothetical protein